MHRFKKVEFTNECVRVVHARSRSYQAPERPNINRRGVSPPTVYFSTSEWNYSDRTTYRVSQEKMIRISLPQLETEGNAQGGNCTERVNMVH